MKTIGVLALQGSFAEHLAMLGRLKGVDPVAVKEPRALEKADGMILPGGESTTLGKLLHESGLFEPLRARISAGMPVWGTCAGLILLAKKIADDDTVHLGLMDIVARRNAYGGQLDSFADRAVLEEVSPEPFPLVFIRAPWIEKAGEGVKTASGGDGRIIAARQKNMIVTSFHPELTDDPRFHSYFAGLV